MARNQQDYQNNAFRPKPTPKPESVMQLSKFKSILKNVLKPTPYKPIGNRRVKGQRRISRNRQNNNKSLKEFQRDIARLQRKYGRYSQFGTK